jgi:hypothetical protein
MIKVSGTMPSVDGLAAHPYQLNLADVEQAEILIRDVAKAVQEAGAHMAVLQIEDRILAALLRACGGTVVIDAHDLASSDPIPNIVCFQREDPWSLVYRLEETPGRRGRGHPL